MLDTLGDIVLGGHNVRWDQQERTELAKIVHRLRAKHPADTLIKLVSRAQEHPWPPHRRRTINAVHQVEWLLPLLREIDREIQIALDQELTSCKQQIEDLLKRPDRETILRQLSEEEAYRRYGHAIISRYLDTLPLEEFYAHLGRRLTGILGELQRAAPMLGKIAAEVSSSAPAPHCAIQSVLLCGLQHHQYEAIKRVIPSWKFEFLAGSARVTDHSVPGVLCVIWLDHCQTPQIQALRRKYTNGCLLEHKGSFDALLDKLRARLE